MAFDLLLALANPMKEVKTGCLMILVFTALFIQFDPRIWNSLCQLLAKLLVGPN